MQLFTLDFVYSNNSRVGNDERQVRKMGRREKFKEVETREKLTRVILEVLDHLPEAQRKVFVWRHYQGLEIDRIAENLHCSYNDVEKILQQIGATLACRTAQMLT